MHAYNGPSHQRTINLYIKDALLAYKKLLVTIHVIIAIIYVPCCDSPRYSIDMASVYYTVRVHYSIVLI